MSVSKLDGEGSVSISCMLKTQGENRRDGSYLLGLGYLKYDSSYELDHSREGGGPHHYQ